MQMRNMVRHSRLKKRDKWGNRIAIVGVTLVVLSLAVVVNLKGAALKAKDLEYTKENMRIGGIFVVS